LPLWERLGLTLGAGVQIAVTQFRSANQNWIISIRLPF
jgi:opacity protein-like surface antigen